MKLTREEIDALPPARRAMLLRLLLQQQAVPAPTGPALVKRGSGSARASYGQERMWVLWELEREGTAYHITGVLRMRGELEVGALEWALNEIVARHEALRTHFRVLEGELRQVVEARWRMELCEEDVRGESEERWRGRLEEESRRPFDLRTLPLMRVKLLRTGEREWSLGVVLHHIVADGWSLGVLESELCRLYSARREGRDADLGELPVQYSDWAQWQRERLSEERLRTWLEWWSRRLEGGERRLWWGRVGRVGGSSSARRVKVELGRELSEGLRELARRQGATLHMVLVAGVAASLSRFTGRDEIRLGMPVAGRSERASEGLIGLFVNTVVVSVRVSERGSFAQLVEEAKEALLGSYERQDVPYEKVVEAVRSAGGATEGALFDLLLGFQNAPRGVLELPGVEAWHEELESREAKFDLSLLLEERAEGVGGTLEYRESRYESGLMEAWVEDLKRCLSRGVSESERALLGVELQGEEQRRRVVEEWNQTAREWAGWRSLVEGIEEQARRTPEAVAVRSSGTGRELSYAELNEGANRLARWLRRRGVGPEQRVGVWLRRGVGLVQAALGVMKAGGAYVPLDERYPLGRLATMVTDSGAKLLLSEAGLGEQLDLPGVEVVRLDELSEELSRESSEVLAVNVERDNLAYVLYTSGSTGVPKGVMLTHRGALNLAGWMGESYGREGLSEVLFSTSLCFDLSVYEVWGTLSWGGCVVVVDDVLGASGERVGLINTVPSAMRELLRLGCVAAGTKTVNLAGEALDGELVRGIFGASGAERVVNLYGPTETTTYSTGHELAREWCARGEAWVPIGRPLSNTRVYVLDAEQRVLPVGVYGELYIGGEGVSRGYLNRGGLTAERFVPEPWGPAGSRMYRTGDRARWRETRELEYAGRLDQQVKVRGYRIELGEIESAARRQEWVDEAVVLARGEGSQRRLVGYATVKPGRTASVEELKRGLRERLPEYMVPAQWVLLERLPLTANGKLDRRRLPEPEESGERRGREAQTEVEKTLAGIWSGLLQRQRVGAEESFFELGGHSLLATQVVARIREVYGVELPLRRLFESPTLAELARAVEAAQGAEAPEGRITRHPEADRLAPLSPAQQRLWFLDQLEPGSGSYNVPAIVEVSGALDVSALQRGVDVLVRRHAALRTSLKLHAGEPAQVVEPELAWTLPVTDLSALEPDERERELARLCSAEARAPFDLAQAPLWRLTLVRLEARRHVIVLVMHHAISDGWSLGVFLREMSELYRAHVTGVALDLPALPIHYTDYALWQRERQGRERLERQSAYWCAQLAGAPAALDLPADRPRPATRGSAGARHELLLPGELSASLGRLARREDVTSFMLLLALFKVLLWRHTGQSDVSVGTPVANRERLEVEGLVGFFANTLVLRTRLRPEASLRELLAQTREVCLGAYAHQELPFERLVEELQPVRDLSRTPLYQVLFVLQNAPLPELELGGARLRPLEFDTGTSKCDLTLSLVEHEGGLRAVFEYSTELFEAATVARLAEHYRRLLERAAENVERPLRELARLDEREQRQLARFEQGRAATRPGERTLLDLIDAQVRARPSATAITWGGERLSYRDLDRAANGLAWRLREAGVGREMLVGVCLERSPELIVALLAVLKAGAAYVPLDPAYPRERVAYMLSDARARVVLCSPELRERVDGDGIRLMELRAGDARAAMRDSPPALAVHADQLAYVTYTSGSTGRPKGVAIPHRAIVRLVDGVDGYVGLGGDDVVLQLAPVAFDASTFELWCALGRGACIAVHPPQMPSLAELGRELRDRGVTTLWLTAGLFHRMAEDQLEDLAGVRQVLAGGDVLSAPLVQRLLSAQADGRVVNGYGPTECTTFAACHVMPAGSRVGGGVPIGRPIPETSVRVLDRDLERVPQGVVGEVYIGGAGLARGYVGRPDLTAERFVPDPRAQRPGERCYRTGDLGRWQAEGVLEFVGRADQQVKLRGYRIEPGEIEACLRAHEGVGDAAVVLRGEGEAKALVAYVVARDGCSPGVDELQEHLRRRLPEYMVPSRLALLDALPLTPNGKLDRGRLPEVERAAPVGAVAPGTPVEQTLADIWAQVLGLESVGVHDDFFQLGGHSLLATRVAARVRDAYGVELPLRRIFEAPRIAALAPVIERLIGERTGAPSEATLSRRPRGGVPARASHAQERMWVLWELDRDGTAYHIAAALRLRGTLDVAALESALGEIMTRHEVLRTRFEVIDGALRQIVEPPVLLDLREEDVRGLAESEWRRRLEDEARRPFDLRRRPLVRARLLRTGESEWVLCLVLHHVVADGWSLGVLEGELGRLYAARCAGGVAPLDELPVQYADWAEWQRENLTDERLAPHIEWWREYLRGAGPLPLPGASAAAGPGRGRPVLRLSLEASEAVRATARRLATTPFCVALAALHVLLHHWTGRNDITVGTVAGHRPSPQTEGLIGPFINYLPLRARVDAQAAGAALLAQVQAAAIEVFEHAACPFEKIVDALADARTDAVSPLFNVVLLVQNFPSERALAPDLVATRLDLGTDESPVDLRLAVADTDGAMLLSADHRGGLFDAAFMQALLEAYAGVLERLAGDPSIPVEQLRPARRFLDELPTPQALAVASTFTADPLLAPLRFWMRKLELPHEVVLAPYDQVLQQLTDPASLLGRNRRGVNVVLVRLEDWLGAGDLRATVRDLAARVEASAAAHTLVGVCPPSAIALADARRAPALAAAEEALAAALDGVPGVELLRPAQVRALYPVERECDPESDRLGHIPYTQAWFVAMGTMLARRMRAALAPPRKVLVLDADDTLWDGLCGELGPCGVRVSAGRRALQEFVLRQREAGMLLCLCSKNDDAAVAETFARHPDMLLRREHVSGWKVNWRPKSENIRALADELSLGLDGFVFLDDSDVECAEVAALCPGVLTLRLPSDEAGVARFLAHAWAFDRPPATREARRRAAFYEQERARRDAQQQVGSLAEFLSGLQLQVEVGDMDPADAARVSELTLRTNQFNCSGVRRTTAEVRDVARASRHRVLSLRVADRFGDYGLAGAAVLRTEGDTLEVETLVLSCRVLGRGVEARVLGALEAAARVAGASRLRVAFVPTERNQPAREFLDAHGVRQADGGYVIAVSAGGPRPAAIAAAEIG